MHEYKNSFKHERTHTLLVHNEQGMWSLQLIMKFLLFKMLPVNTKLELELKFVS